MRDLRTDVYPGYEWVLTITGDVFETIEYVEKVFKKEGIDGYCPGTSGSCGGILVVYSQAEKARALLRDDAFLKGKWVYLEEPEGNRHL